MNDFDRPRIWTDASLHPDALKLLASVSQFTPNFHEADAAIVGSLFQGDRDAFQRAPNLRVVARLGMGYDQIDLDAASDAGVLVTHTPSAPTESTAEFTIALILAVARQLPSAAARLQSGFWEQGSSLIGTDLAGHTLGLIGCGRIGRRVAEIAAAFHMEVIAFDPSPTPLPDSIRRCASLPQLLDEADIISLHAPLTPTTRQLLGPSEFAQMKSGVIVVNTARGPLIDERALLAALESNQVGGAGLDVWDPEPPHQDSLLITHPRVVATPHMAAFTSEGKRRSHLGAAAQVLAVLRGEKPDPLLNPEAWSKV